MFPHRSVGSSRTWWTSCVTTRRTWHWRSRNDPVTSVSTVFPATDTSSPARSIRAPERSPSCRHAGKAARGRACHAPTSSAPYPPPRHHSAKCESLVHFFSFPVILHDFQGLKRLKAMSGVEFKTSGLVQILCHCFYFQLILHEFKGLKHLMAMFGIDYKTLVQMTSQNCC